MNNLLYWLRQINPKEIWDLIDWVDDRSPQSKPAILWDMVCCAIRYGASPRDYALLGMDTMEEQERQTILTGYKNEQYIRYLNQPEDEHFFNNKLEFLGLFKEEYGREYLNLSASDADTFADFAISHPSFIAKAEEDPGGGAAEICELSPEEGLIGLYNRLKTSNKTLLEEALEQHEALQKLYPNAVNTVQMVTMIDGHGEPHLIYTALRIGRGGALTDHFNEGGLIVPINPKNGKLEKYAVDQERQVYERHPDTDIAFDGYSLPLWKEIMLLTHKASKKVSGIRLVDWIIAITPNRPVLIKGNLRPNQEFYRPYPQNEGKCGLLPAYEAVLPYTTVKNSNSKRRK